MKELRVIRGSIGLFHCAHPRCLHPSALGLHVILILAALIYITSALHCTAEIMHTKQTTRPAGLICRLCNGDDQSHHMECLAHSLARPRSILCCLAVLLLAILLSCCLTALLSCCLAAFAVCSSPYVSATTFRCTRSTKKMMT